MSYTEFELQEIIKCRDDIAYFADNYIKILHIDLGTIQIKLNDFQNTAIKKYNTEKTFFIPTARQQGKTTVASIILLHQALFTDYRVSCIFAHNKHMSDIILDMIKDMYDLLPEYLKITKIITRNKGKLEFDNMCSIISAGSNVDYARCRALSNIYIDESEWVKNVGEMVRNLYPCMSSINHSKLFSFSSSKVGEIFNELNLK